MNFLLSKYLFILILPFFGFCQHKAGIVDYGIKFNDTKYQEFLNNDKDQKKRVRFYMNEIFTNHKKVYSQDIVFIKLKFNQNEYRADPVDIMFPETVNQQMIMRNPTIYGNLKQNIYLEKFKKQGNVFLAELPNNFEWEITNEYKIIAGYKCRKAILRKESNPKLDYKVWFTPQIPIAFSPVRYSGLPGAILGISTSMKYIYAKNIEFKDDLQVEKPTDGVKLSAEEYKEMFSGFKKPD